MSDFDWNEDKDKWLRKERGIVFEDIVNAIENDMIIRIINTPSTKYKNQKIMLALLNDYIYMVPYVAVNNVFFQKPLFLVGNTPINT